MQPCTLSPIDMNHSEAPCQLRTPKHVFEDVSPLSTNVPTLKVLQLHGPHKDIVTSTHPPTHTSLCGFATCSANVFPINFHSADWY